MDHILILFSGVLCRAIDKCERLSALRTMRCASAAKACFCQCAGHQPSRSDSADSLLVVQSLTSLKALRAALQPICDNSLTGGSETIVTQQLVLTAATHLHRLTTKGITITFTVMRRALFFSFM